jgi:predicted O-methyltransferase YrrM
MTTVDTDGIIARASAYIESTLRPITDAIGEEVEGNIFDEEHNVGIFLPKRKNITVAAQGKTNALEIGFNAGFSTVLFLMSNPELKMTCVDIGLHRYTVPCYEQIKRDFGDRVNLLVGDSVEVVPTIQDKFDLIHIDGGHGLYVAERDICNTFRLLQSPSIIIMDDVNIYNNSPLGNVWKRYTEILRYRPPPFEQIINEHQDIRMYIQE